MTHNQFEGLQDLMAMKDAGTGEELQLMPGYK
jgi:hypothetical protein